MKKQTTFYIVRHGQSEANSADIIAGQLDSMLSQEGARQAEKRAQDLQIIHFDIAFSSSSQRAHRTAKIIANKHGLPVIAVDALRERHYGETIQGKRHSDLGDVLQKQFDDYNAMEFIDRFSYKFIPDMESDEEIIARFTNFLQKTAREHTGKTILIVAHGNMMRTLLVHLRFGNLKELSHGTIPNTGYFVLKTNGETFEIEKTVGIEKKQA